jgi:hypothetical protein
MLQRELNDLKVNNPLHPGMPFGYQQSKEPKLGRFKVTESTQKMYQNYKTTREVMESDQFHDVIIEN